MYLELIITAVFVAVVAITWVTMLTDPGDIFDWFPRLVQRITKNEKINKVLHACERCFAGQFALWSYFGLMDGYSFFEHFAYIILSIFFAGILNPLIQRL